MKNFVAAIVALVKKNPAITIGAVLSIAVLVYQIVKGQIDPAVALPLISGIITHNFVTPAQTGTAKNVADAVQAEVDALIAEATPFIGSNPTFDQLKVYYENIKVYKAAVEASLPAGTGYDVRATIPVEITHAADPASSPYASVPSVDPVVITDAAPAPVVDASVPAAPVGPVEAPAVS